MASKNSALRRSIRSRKRERSPKVFEIDEDEFVRSITRFFEMELHRPTLLGSVLSLIDKLHEISKSRMKKSTSSSSSEPATMRH